MRANHTRMLEKRCTQCQCVPSPAVVCPDWCGAPNTTLSVYPDSGDKAGKSSAFEQLVLSDSRLSCFPSFDESRIIAHHPAVVDGHADHRRRAGVTNEGRGNWLGIDGLRPQAERAQVVAPVGSSRGDRDTPQNRWVTALWPFAEELLVWKRLRISHQKFLLC